MRKFRGRRAKRLPNSLKDSESRLRMNRLILGKENIMKNPQQNDTGPIKKHGENNAHHHGTK